jgi:hypothetical protein
MNIMECILFHWFLGTFKREKQKNAKATLPCVFWNAHGKVTKTNNRNSAFAVRLSDARQWCHWLAPLPCVFRVGARQRILVAVRFGLRRTTKGVVCRALWTTAHGKGSHTPSHPGAVSCFFLPCASPWRMAKIIHRALSATTHDNRTYRAKFNSVSFAVRPTKNARQRVFRTRDAQQTHSFLVSV